MKQDQGASSSSILTAASDIALLLDHAGAITHVTVGLSEHPLEESRDWLGRHWIDTVTAGSRASVAEMFAEAVAQGVSSRRQVSHLSAVGTDIPFAYTVVRADGDQGTALAIGRDLRAVSALQERLVEAQQSLERDYWRMRHVEARYRLLLQLSTEAVLVLDGASQKVIEANPAAARLFDQPLHKLEGRTFPFDIEVSSASSIAGQLATVRAHGRADDLMVRLAGSGRKVRLMPSLIRQDAATFFVVRLLPLEQATSDDGPASAAAALELVESMPDGFAVADAAGRIVLANRALLDMVQVPTLEQARGHALADWVGRPGADMTALLATVREHGVARLFSTALRGELGSEREVEVSSVGLQGAGGLRVALVIRDVGRRLLSSPSGARDLGQAVGQLTALVGRVSLKTLVRDTTGLVERHFIEAALEKTRNNRTSAAEMLGLSRQSLYIKLKRYGFDADGDGSRADPRA